MAIARMYVIKKDSTVLILDESCEVDETFIAERDITFHESWVVQESVCVNPDLYSCPRELFMIFRHEHLPYIQVSKSNIVTKVVEDVSDGSTEDSYLDDQVNKVYH
jgi:hypothetical protein